MIISCIGDSLTEGDYGIPGKKGIANVHAENYPFFLSQLLGVQVNNYGKCGYRSTTYLKHFREGNADVTSSNIILIMLGTNGGQSPTDENAAENVAYDTLVKECREAAPHAEIVLMTPPNATANPALSGCGAAPQVKQAVDFVRLYAAREKLPVIEVACCPELTPENEHIMQANDGVHFVEIGYRTLAAFVAAELKKLFPMHF